MKCVKHKKIFLKMNNKFDFNIPWNFQFIWISLGKLNLPGFGDLLKKQFSSLVFTSTFLLNYGTWFLKEFLFKSRYDLSSSLSNQKPCYGAINSRSRSLKMEQQYVKLWSYFPLSSEITYTILENIFTVWFSAVLL